MNDKSYELDSLESLQIKLASKDTILKWSHGEVTKPETINYRTLKPEKDGLFCEKIFGPTKDWECNCGKYKKSRFKGLTCPKCGVEVTQAKVRRERMGHIELASPVSHIWFFKAVPSKMGEVLALSPKRLENVLYFTQYIVTDPGDTGLEYKQILSEEEYREAKETFGNSFSAGMGAGTIKKLLEDIDLDKLTEELNEEINNSSGQKRTKLVKRLSVVESLRASNSRPEWMIMDVIPVIPPDLRPMVQLDGGRFATSDLNDLYRRVINRNNRLKKTLEIGAPEIIVRNEKRMLQEAVDSLIDNGRRGKAVTGSGGRPLKSLSDMLKGKQGRFRQNLLGKRVDYSGRSVIVVGPELRFWQCGIPKRMALELFKPFIIRGLIEKKDAQNPKNAKKMVDSFNPEVWDILDEVVKDHPVMLNRAPTLHRLGIQAFEPVLIDGKAIKLHPLVCTAFNADFDGDQMAVHVPLSVEAQAEARYLMLSVNNILAPRDGSPITTPTQDMVLGAYYLTFPGLCEKKEKDKVIERIDEFADEERNYKEGFKRVPEKGDGKAFADMEEMMMAYHNREISIHAKVKVRLYVENDKQGKVVQSTVGRFIYNQGIYQDLGFVDREKDKYSLEVDFLCKKKNLEQIIDKCYRKHGNTETAVMLDYIKDTGYHYSTRAAVTIGVSDMEIPDEKETLIAEADEKVEGYEELYEEGQLSENERYKSVIKVWDETTDKVADALMDTLHETNNLRIMANSGARGNRDQIKQVGGMRGLMANATGETIEIPVKSNFREGLSILEYFISSNGARKGLTDTALRTADSGYLTRRLVDVSHNVIIREEDCGTDEGIIVTRLGTGKDPLETLTERIEGRTACETIKHPKTGDVIVEKGEEISAVQAKEIEDSGIEEVKVRSVLTCRSKVGVCAKCYGRNLATREHVNIGESVGIIAAQSIGEPGTQLTMRTFHTGGLAGGDITQGLQRVEELFEARRPKGQAEICTSDGEVVSISTREDNMTEIKVKQDDGEEKDYVVSYGAIIDLKPGDKVKAGGHITGGSLYPQDILKILGARGVHEYILEEVQKVYRSEGVDISDKHIEVIVSRMLSRVVVTDPGDTGLLKDTEYDKIYVQGKNDEVIAEGKKPAEFDQTLLGISKAALATESFLSAASFQETTKVLTNAAIKGKVDHLVGLKENVIVGKLIPAGTGISRYRTTEVDYGANSELMENFNKVVEVHQENAEQATDAASGVEGEGVQNQDEMIKETVEPSLQETAEPTLNIVDEE